LKKILVITATAGLLATTLSGCGTSSGADGQTIDVVGKIQIASFLGLTGDNGNPCTGQGDISLGLNGQQVKLKDAAGEIVGVANLEGWMGDPSSDLNPAAYGYFDGAVCSWDFTFPGVTVDSNFYTLEFSDKRVVPPTITKEEILNGPVISLK
jgi:hypothetical protein